MGLQESGSTQRLNHHRQRMKGASGDKGAQKCFATGRALSEITDPNSNSWFRNYSGKPANSDDLLVEGMMVRVMEAVVGMVVQMVDGSDGESGGGDGGVSDGDDDGGVAK